MNKYTYMVAACAAACLLASCSSSTLHSAAEKGNVAKIQKLLTEGKDINERDQKGRTPLMYACMSQQPQAALLLIEKSADAKALDDKRWTPLHIVARYLNEPGAVQVAQSLLDHGADVNARTADGVMPLMLAAATNDDDITRLLISRGAQLNAVTGRGSNALDIAYSKNAKDVAKILQDKGLKANNVPNPWAAAAPANIDNMVYKERGTVIFTTGRRSGDGSYYSANGGGEGAHFGAPGGSWGISYQKTGAKKATIGRWSGHSTSATYLQFTTPTSGYVYRCEMESRGNESVSNERIPFTLEHL